MTDCRDCCFGAHQNQHRAWAKGGVCPFGDAMPPKSRAKGASGSGAKGAGSNPAAEDSWARDQAVSTLNDAKLAGDATQKCAHLKTLAELVVHKDAGLLDEFLEPLLEMRVDTNAAVRKTIAGLCEQIAVAHPARIAPCVEATRHLLGDDAAAVAKAAAKGATALYKQAFVYVSNKGKGVGAKKTVPKAVKDIWKAAKNLDEDLKAFALSEKANDGARMQAVRFLEKTLCFLCAVAPSLTSDHALLNPDDIATECDSLLGVLLECLKPDAMHKQSSPATLVMIAAAANVAERCAQYCEFVVPALCELAEAVGKAKIRESSAATASIGKELKSQLVALTKLDHAEMDEHRDAVDAALRESLDAAAEADAARTRRERVEARKREREDRGSGSANKRRRGDDDDDDDLDLERSGTPDASGDDGFKNAQVTPKHLLAQVLTTVDALARTDRAVLEGFVSRLAPEVLADVVLASLENADVRLLGGRVAVDVAAGMGAGAEGFVEWAADTHARGGGRDSTSQKLAASGTAETSAADFEKTEPEPETEKSDVSGRRPAKPPAPFVFAPKIETLSKESRDAHAAAALARIVKAADPGGAVAAMGGATVQRALFARLAAAATAQTAAKSFSSFSAFSSRGAEARASDTIKHGGSLSVGVLASRPSDDDESKDLAGALLETLVAALPDPNAHAAVTRVLGATFVNETAVALDANDTRESSAPRPRTSTTSIAPAGAYSRALMTVVVGLLESDSSARLKHVAKVLVDAPAVPPAAIALLRALCRLPLGGAEDDPNALPESAFVSDADPETSLGFTVSREETDASGGFVSDVAEKKKVSSRHRRVVRWGGVPLPDSSDVVNAALASLLELVTRRPTARAKCLEIALEAATSADEDVRARAIRAVVGKLHPVETLAKAVEAYAEFHLGVAAGAGAAALADARRVAAEASAAMRRAAEKRAAAERAREAEAKRLKAEAEGFAAKPVSVAAASNDAAPAPPDATTEEAFTNPEGKSRAENENDDGVVKASTEAQETLRRVEAAAVASAVAAVSRHILLFCALCNRERALLPKVFRAFATLPEELRPALLDDAGAGVVTTGGFDGLVRLVGPECGPLLDAVRNPPKGSESLAARAIRVLADADAAEAEYLRDAAAAGGVVAGDAAKDHAPRASMDALVSAAETLAAKVRAEAEKNARRTDGANENANDSAATTTNAGLSSDEESHEDIELLLPLLGAMSAEKVRALVPRLVALPPDLFKRALDRLCGERSPLSPSELFVALHEVDPATRGVGLKKIIAACGECFERPESFGAETLASAMSKMVEMHPLPLLFMRTVIQAESAWPTLREFTVNILRSLAAKKVWKADAKIWEGFVRCAKRAAPRSFPVLIQMPEAPLLEILKKFPALVEPLRAYANAPAVAGSVPRAVRDALAKA